jgi:magnesium-transporting ATPase (P-type)
MGKLKGTNSLSVSRFERTKQNKDLLINNHEIIDNKLLKNYYNEIRQRISEEKKENKNKLTRFPFPIEKSLINQEKIFKKLIKEKKIKNEKITETEFENPIALEGKEFRNLIGKVIKTYDKKEKKTKIKIENITLFKKVIKNLKIISRATPEDKFLLVFGLKKLDNIIAFIISKKFLDKFEAKKLNRISQSEDIKKLNTKEYIEIVRKRFIDYYTNKFLK